MRTLNTILDYRFSFTAREVLTALLVIVLLAVGCMGLSAGILHLTMHKAIIGILLIVGSINSTFAGMRTVNAYR